MDYAWDRLLDRVDHFAATPGVAVGPGDEAALAQLCAEAAAVGDIDGELHVADTARWIAGLVAGYRAVRATHPEVDPDRDLADLRLILTRWLHPARPR